MCIEAMHNHRSDFIASPDRWGVSERMNVNLKTTFEREMSAMREAYAARNFDASFHHLERAHILGQRHFVPHLWTHWWMLKIGTRRKDIREIFGQCLRLAAVFPASLFGWVPVGNTGGANVSALKPMPIPDDLEDLLRSELD